MSRERRDWFEVSRVRVGQRPRVDLEDDGRPFVAALCPYLEHPEVLARGADAREHLLRRALARYLFATQVLELELVNPVARRIAAGEGAVRFETSARQAALEVYCDEAYHALLAQDLQEQLGLQLPAGGRPALLERLDRLRREARDERERELIDLLFVCLCETLLSAHLSTLGEAPEVLVVVRDFVSEHARDEARHGRFFGQLLGEIWVTMTPRERDRLGPSFPALMAAFLDPDEEALAADLEAVGVPAARTAAVLDEGLPESWRLATRRQACRPTLQWLERVGCLEHAPTRAALASAGLVGA